MLHNSVRGVIILPNNTTNEGELYSHVSVKTISHKTQEDTTKTDTTMTKLGWRSRESSGLAIKLKSRLSYNHIYHELNISLKSRLGMPKSIHGD